MESEEKDNEADMAVLDDTSEFEPYEPGQDEETVNMPLPDGDDDTELTQVYDMGVDPHSEYDQFEADEVPLFESDEPDDIIVVEEKPKKKAKAKPVRKKKSRKSLVFLFLLILVGGGIYGANYMGYKIPYLNYATDILRKVPYVKDFIGPAADEGEITPLANTIEGEFVLNDKIGTLFVIKGSVRNDFTRNRDYILVSGTLFTQGKKTGNERDRLLR